MSTPTPNFYALWDACLAPHEQTLVARAQAFCEQHLIKFAHQAHAERLPLSKPLVRAWAALGLQGMQTPKALGGQGASYLTRIRVVQVLAQHGFAAAFSLNNTHSLVTMVATQASDTLRARYLPALLSGDLVATVALTEPGGGSDLAATRSTAQKVSGGWVLNGEKAWITNASIADIAIVTAQTATGTRGIGRFLVALDNPGVQRTALHPVSAGYAVGLAGFRLSDVFVPDTHLLEAPGEGFKRTMSSINGARVHVAAMAVAALAAALSEALHYCAQRQAFGKPLLQQQGLAWQLADVATQLEAANALVYRAAQYIHAGEPAELAAAHAKKFATRAAIQGIETCMQSMGAYAMLDHLPLARQWAELKMAGYADGTSEILNARITAHLLTHYGKHASP